MKKLSIFSLFLCCVAWGYSQENVTGHYDDRGKTQMQTDLSVDSVLKLDKFTPQPGEGAELFNFQNSYTTPDFRYRNPWGYTNQHIGMLYPNWHYSITGTSDVWPGITVINSAAFGLHYSQDNFMLNVGTDLWKYGDMNRPYNDMTFHADASYQLLPWLLVGAYGQYATFAKNNVRDGSALSSPMIPFTQFGGYSRVMFNSTFGVEGAVGRQYNPIKGKWEPTYGIGPVIEFKKKKR